MSDTNEIKVLVCSICTRGGDFLTNIRVEMSEWLFNAGIVGLVNILKYAGNEVRYDGQSIEFDSDYLEGFENKYFGYLIDTYEKTLAWYRIVSFKDFISNHEKNEYKDFDVHELNRLNDYIGSGSKAGSLKYYLKSNSYKSGYELIESVLNPLNLEKEINPVKIKKGQAIADILKDIKIEIGKIKTIIGYFQLEETKKYLGCKNVIYTIINKSWSGVSFLNSQTKEKNMYKDFKDYFVKDALVYLDTSQNNNKYRCFSCDRKMKDMNSNLSFMNFTGFDANRKPSNVWNFKNDIAICPICKLIYSCVPAGFTYTYNRGIFINENHSVENCVRINRRIRTEVFKDTGNQNSTFRALSVSIGEAINESNRYEYSDIQVVRYDDNNGNPMYRFNILSKKSISIINNCKDDLDHLVKCGFKEINTYYSVYEEIMKNILNNENLFLLLHKMISIKLTNTKNATFNSTHLNYLQRINLEFLKGAGMMENIEKDLLKSYRIAGYYLREAYVKKNSNNKLNGISYRLLNSLKTNNPNMFMDTVLNCYLYTGKQVPNFLIDCLRDAVTYKTIGYAFVSGLIEDKTNRTSGGND